MTQMTYLPTNQFRFNCPIFGAEVAIRQCFQLRDEWAKGRKIEQRRGCQACLSASKCPIVSIIKRIQIHDEDHYYSKEPKVGKLQPKIIESIGRIIVSDHVINAYQPIPENQMKCIESVQGLKGLEVMGKNMGLTKIELEEVIETTAPKDYYPSSKPREKNVKITVASDPNINSADEYAAAETGDMSAALNKMVDQETL